MARLRLSLYANDVIVFVKPIKADFDLTMTILQRFDDATGLRINLQKSAVAPIRCPQLNLMEVLQNFTGTQVQFPVTYLRLPICLGRLRMVHFQPHLDRAATRLAGWQGKLMNISGRRELVKTVLALCRPTYSLPLSLPSDFTKTWTNFGGDSYRPGVSSCK
jgi:hypothetical protein